MKTLLVYATKYGCTEKCAEILVKKLAGEVDLCNLKEMRKPELSQYDQVVIGGSIYTGKIQKEVNEFCSENREVLLTKRLGLFICGMLKEKAQEELNNSFIPELFNHAVAKEFFGGEFRFKSMNALERFIVKMVAKGDGSIPAIDIKKDLSVLAVENINRLAESLNNA